MSQPDSQALLQSMLERLKLQPGRERLVYESPRQEIEKDVLTNGYVLDDPAKRPQAPFLAAGEFSPKVVEGFKPVHDIGQYRGHFSFPKVDSHTTVVAPLEHSTNHSEGTDTLPKKDMISGKQESESGFKLNDQDWYWGSSRFSENHSFHVGNGFENMSKWKDMQTVPQKSSTKRKPRFSESKAKRWTQKLKERWVERSHKKERESAEDWAKETSAQSRLVDTLNQDGEERENPSPPLEDDTIEAFIGSGEKFPFGFGSVSLLDEIIAGQEWAKFLNSASTNRTIAENTLNGPDVTPRATLSVPSAFATHHSESLNRQWSFRGGELLPLYNFPCNKDLPEASTEEADQFQPMEQGQSQSHEPIKDSEFWSPRNSNVERADILDDSPPTSRLNRKRQHHSAENWTQNRQEESANNHVMGNAEENMAPFIGCPSSEVSPGAPPLRSVLRHPTFPSIDSSQESKRRRLEPNRRVRFAETVQEIPPIRAELDTWESEEDDGTVLGSGSDEEEEKERMAVEEEKAARRPALPAWIRNLKRKNTPRKHT
ncbi:uncharacterized protein LOC144082061 [Stigmatopora argus]